MTFFFLRREDGQYLQQCWDRTTKQMDYWWDVKPAWTPAFTTEAEAMQYRNQLFTSHGWVLRVSKENHQ